MVKGINGSKSLGPPLPQWLSPQRLKKRLSSDSDSDGNANRCTKAIEQLMKQPDKQITTELEPEFWGGSSQGTQMHGPEPEPDQLISCLMFTF